MLAKLLHRIGSRGWHLQVSSLAGVWLCLSLWIRAETVDQSERGNAERRALFVGLRPATLYLIGNSLDAVDRRRPRSLFGR